MNNMSGYRDRRDERDGRSGGRKRSRSPGRRDNRRERSRSRSIEREHRRQRRDDSDFDRKDDRRREDGTTQYPVANGTSKAPEEPPKGQHHQDIALDADLSPEEIQMMISMGIPFGFDTTQGKHVEDERANAGAVKVKTTRSARQYMNRKRGFNRPLPAETTGKKVVRD